MDGFKNLVAESVDDALSPSTSRHLRKVKQPRREEKASQSTMLSTPIPGLAAVHLSYLKEKYHPNQLICYKIGRNTNSKKKNANRPFRRKVFELYP